MNKRGCTLSLIFIVLLPVLLVQITQLGIWSGPCNPLAVFAWTFYEPLIFLIFLVMPFGWFLLPMAMLRQMHIRGKLKSYTPTVLWYIWIGQAMFLYLMNMQGRPWPIFYSPYC